MYKNRQKFDVENTKNAVNGMVDSDSRAGMSYKKYVQILYSIAVNKTMTETLVVWPVLQSSVLHVNTQAL